MQMKDNNVVEYSRDKYETCQKCGKKKADVTTRIIKPLTLHKPSALVKWCNMCWVSHVTN